MWIGNTISYVLRGASGAIYKAIRSLPSLGKGTMAHRIPQSSRTRFSSTGGGDGEKMTRVTSRRRSISIAFPLRRGFVPCRLVSPAGNTSLSPLEAPARLQILFACRKLLSRTATGESPLMQGGPKARHPRWNQHRQFVSAAASRTHLHVEISLIVGKSASKAPRDERSVQPSSFASPIRVKDTQRASECQ